MLILTDQLLDNFQADSYFQIQRHHNLTLDEYLTIQSKYSSKKKKEVTSHNIVVYCFGYNDILADVDIFSLVSKYQNLLKGKLITYIIVPPGFSLDFTEACMEEFCDDLNLIYTLMNINGLPSDDDLNLLNLDLLEINCLLDCKINKK